MRLLCRILCVLAVSGTASLGCAHGSAPGFDGDGATARPDADLDAQFDADVNDASRDAPSQPFDANRPDARELDAADPDGALVADANTKDAKAVDAKAAPTDAEVASVDAPVTSIDAAKVKDAAVPDARVAIDAAPACTLVSQTGCTVGLACDLDQAKLATAGTYCRAINTAGTEPSTCTGPTRCAAGLMCINGTCRRFCNADTDCTAPGGKCEIEISYGPGTVPGVKLCTKNCNPMTASGCPALQGCHVSAYANGTKVLTDCDGAGTSGQDAVCTDATICQAGYECVGPQGGATCLKYCRYDPAGGDCGAGQSCYSFQYALVVGPQEYGVCDKP